MTARIMALLIAASALAWGCVITTKHTIDAHITVDIRHIEKQADTILDYVEGKTDALPNADKASKDTKAADKPKNTSLLRNALQCLNPIQSAYAAEMKQNSPAIEEIVKRQRARNAKLDELKTSGAVGESNRGFVELRPSDKLNDAAKKNEAQQLISAENADRKLLYKEIAALNQDQNMSVGVVERVFAQKRLVRAKPGQVFQLPDAGDDFDAFKKSELGKKIADCKPGAWVTIK